MRFKPMLTALTVSAVSLTALTTLFAAPAQAGPNGGCDTENTRPRVCLFENKDFNAGQGASGDHWRTFTANDSDFRNNNWLDRNSADSGDGMDNETSSIKTSIGTACAWIYQHVNYEGASSMLGALLWAESLDRAPIGDNRASSLDIVC